jgi:hypothetical protein
VAKYLKLTGPAGAVTCFIYLSQSPFQAYTANQTVNLAQVKGTDTPASLLAGSLVVGGAVASGSTIGTYPMPVSGVDDLKAPLVRNILTDSLGRNIIATNTGQIPGTTGPATPLNPLGYLATYKNILTIQEMSQNDEGKNIIELLTHILNELKIMTFQLYELPRLIDEGKSAIDEPAQLRENDLHILN